MLFHHGTFYPNSNAIEITQIPNIKDHFSSIQQKGELVLYSSSKNTIRQIVRVLVYFTNLSYVHASVGKTLNDRFFIILAEGDISQIISVANQNSIPIILSNEVVNFDGYICYSIVPKASAYQI